MSAPLARALHLGLVIAGDEAGRVAALDHMRRVVGLEEDAAPPRGSTLSPKAQGRGASGSRGLDVLRQDFSSAREGRGVIVLAPAVDLGEAHGLER